MAFTVTIHLAHVIETGERRERFREDRAGEMGSEGDQGGDVTWGVSTSMCSWYSHSRFPMQRGRLEYRIAGQTCGVWWALAAQRQSGRALSCLRQGAKFNDVRCPHRVVLDVSTPALDMKGFRLSQRREAPPPTRAFVLAAAAMRMRERQTTGREETCPARSRCWSIQLFVVHEEAAAGADKSRAQ